MKEYIAEFTNGIKEVAKTSYEMLRLGWEVAKNPRALGITAAVLVTYLASCTTARKHQIPTARSCRIAAQTEAYVENGVNGIEGMLEDGKIDANELNDLNNGKKYLTETGKTLDTELEAAKERKDDTAVGALTDVQDELDKASGIVDSVLNTAEEKGKVKAYIGFNLTSGKGLKPGAWDRYAVEVSYKEAAEKFGNPAEWTKVPVKELFYFAGKIKDEVAKEAVNYFLKNGGIDPSSVHVKTEFLGAELSEEEQNAIRGATEAFKQLFMETKEQEQGPPKPEEKTEPEKKEKEL